MKYLFSLWARCSWFTRVSTITFRSAVTVHTIRSALSLITSFSVSSGITDWSINTCQSDISLLSRCSTITTSTCDKRRKMVDGVSVRLRSLQAIRLFRLSQNYSKCHML